MSKQLELTVRIDANGNIIGKLKETVSGVDSVNSAVKGLTDTQTKLGNASEVSFGKTKKGLQSISEQLSSTKAQFLSYLAATVSIDAVKGVVSIADSYKAMQGQLALVTTSAQELASVQDRLNQVSMASFAVQSATTKLYSSMQPALAEMGKSTSEAIRFTELFNKSLSLTAPTTSESQAAILQFAQAMGSGVLRGDEFNSMMENGRGVMQMLAEGMGKPIGELRKMAEAGQLTADVVYNALTNASDSIETNFNKMPMTVGKAITNLNTGFFNFIGVVDQASGATEAIANTINSAGTVFNNAGDKIGTLASVVIPAFAVGLTVKAIPAIWATSTALNVATASAGGFTAAILAASRASLALMATPLGAALTAAGVAAAYLTFRTDETAIAVAKLTEKSKELNVELSSKEAERQAKELIKLQQELQGLMARKQSGAVDVLGVKEAELRQRIADMQNLSQKTAELKTQSELLLAQERGMGTQLEQLYQQTRDFGLSVDDTAKSLGVYTVATSTSKEATSSAKDLVKGLQEQYALLGLSARDAAIAKAQFAAMDKGATSGELAYITETTAAIFDQNKATQALAQAKTQAASTTKKASEEAKAALDKWFNEGFSGAEKASARLSEFHTKLESDLQRIRYEIDPTQEAFDEYSKKLETLALAMQTGKITADEYSDAVLKLGQTKLESPLKNVKDEGLKDLQELKNAIDGWGKDSARAMADFALSGKASFSDFANSVVKDILTMIIYENMTKTLTKGVGSLVNMGISYFTGNSLAGSNVSTDASFVGPVKPFAKGGYTGDGGVYEEAGIVHKGEYVIPQYLVKANPELIRVVESARVANNSNIDLSRVNSLTKSTINHSVNSQSNSSVSNDLSKAINHSVNSQSNNNLLNATKSINNQGDFTNSIVNSPTAFKFANGGGFNLGVMGEAGPEAVMPLTRIGGKLGVLAQGVGGGGASTNVVINVTNTAGDAVQARANQSTNSNGDTVIDVVIERVKGALLQDVGNNGSFSQAMSGAYGLSRRAF